MPIEEQLVFCKHCGLLYVCPLAGTSESPLLRDFQKEFNTHVQKCMKERYEEQLILKRLI